MNTEKIPAFGGNKKFKLLLSLFVFVPVLFLSGCGEKSVPYVVDLEIWGTFDSGDVFTKIVTDYKEVNPYVGDIKFRKISQDTYKTDLIDALASGNGPDIFIINNAWLPSFESKMEPAPQFLVGLDKVKENFIDVVQSDFVINGSTYALPLSVDSLALYYNKSLLNSAGITSPPTTWEEFNDAIFKLTKIDESGKIIQSGAAMGTAYNINRSTDILGMLMLQNGVKMVDDNKRISKMRDSVVGLNGDSESAGEKALQYYSQFSNINSPFYTWNNQMHYSLDAFSEGNLAMMFNYSWHIETIKNKNAKIYFDVAPVPQAQELNKVSYANYWGYGVSKNKIVVPGKDPSKPVGNNNARIHESWQFIKFLTMKNQGAIRLYNAYTKNSADFPIIIDPAADYIEKTNRPAARKDLLEKQKSDPDIGVFAKGNLIAKNWYQKNPELVEKTFADMIDMVTKGGVGTYEAISWATSKISDSMK